jgi:hypothetical protein
VPLGEGAGRSPFDGEPVRRAGSTCTDLLRPSIEAAGALIEADGALIEVGGALIEADGALIEAAGALIDAPRA